MPLKKINILGEKAFHVFVDRPAQVLENLLRNHLGMRSQGPHNVLVFNQEHIHELNKTLEEKRLPKVGIVKENPSLQAYKNLALPNAGQPSKPNHHWLYSYTAWEYDTPSGELENFCYAIEPSGRVIIQLESDQNRIARNSEAEVLAEFDVIT